jgi:hypothetical protein
MPNESVAETTARMKSLLQPLVVSQEAQPAAAQPALAAPPAPTEAPAPVQAQASSPVEPQPAAQALPAAPEQPATRQAPAKTARTSKTVLPPAPTTIGPDEREVGLTLKIPETLLQQMKIRTVAEKITIREHFLLMCREKGYQIKDEWIRDRRKST